VTGSHNLARLAGWRRCEASASLGDGEPADQLRDTDLLLETLAAALCEPGQLLDEHGRRSQRCVDEPVEQGLGDGSFFSHETTLLPGSPGPDPLCSYAVSAQEALLVCELRLALDEETGPADELSRLLGQHAKSALPAVLGIGRLLLFVLVIVDDDQAFFQDHIKARFDVVIVEVIVVLVFALDRRHVALDDDTDGDHVVIVVVEIVDQRDVTEVVVVLVIEQIRLCKIVEVRLIGLGNLQIVHLDGLFQICSVLSVLAHKRPSSDRCRVSRCPGEPVPGTRPDGL